MVAMNLENQTKRTDASLSAVQNSPSSGRKAFLDRIQELVMTPYAWSGNANDPSNNLRNSALDVTNRMLAEAIASYSALERASDHVALLNANLQEANDR